MNNSDEALHHLGGVLYILSNLHEDYQCVAYKEALAFYNAKCPNERVEPEEEYSTKLITTGPLDAITPK